LSEFEKAMELLSENKFSEALSALEKQKNMEDPTLQESVLSNLIKIKSILNKKTAEDKINLAEIMIQNRKFKEAKTQLVSIKESELNSKKKWLYLLYKANSKSGLIQDALDVAKLYIKELLAIRKYHILEAFLPELVQELGAAKLAERLEIESKIAHGNIGELENRYELALKNFSEGKEIDHELISFINRLLTERGKAFSKTALYKATRVISSFGEGLSPDTAWDRKKRIINEVFDGVLSAPESPVFYRILIRYATEARRKDLAYNAIEYMQKNKDKLGLKRGELKRIEKLSDEIITWPEDSDKDTNYEDLDMGTDLFKEYNEGSNIFQKIKKLERDIDFLRSTDNEEEVQILLEELRSLDDEHTLVKELNEKKTKGEASRLKGKKNSLESVKDSLLEQIQRFISEPVSDESDRSFERNLSIQITHMDEKLFENNKTDLVVALKEMSLFNAALKCLERNIPEDESIDEKMNYLNLKVQLLRESGRIHEALDVCQETIANYPLTDEEKINFVYMEGELARDMKKNSQAVAAYKWVEMIHPGYRLVRQRLREFEQS